MNQIEQYYINQAGNGISGVFTGIKYQKGHGFFGRLLSGAVLPFLRFLGRNVLNAGAKIASDIADTDSFNVESIKEIAKNRAKEQTKEMLKRGAEKVLTGRGMRRYKRRRRYRVKPKRSAKHSRSTKRKVFKKTTKRKRVKRLVKDFLSI